jgi:hypothetical protein
LKTNIILIDFENVQPSNLAQLRGRDFKIKVFLGAHQTKLPTATVLGIHPLGPAASEYIRIEGNGPNALDFHIAYYIGRLSAEFPGAHFHIVSKDSGFDPLIKHLKTQNIVCQRSSSLDGIPGLTVAAPDAPSGWVEKVEANLARRGASKPTKLKTLTTSIKAILGIGATDDKVSDVIDQLIQRGTLAISNGKVTYPSP